MGMDQHEPSAALFSVIHKLYRGGRGGGEGIGEERERMGVGGNVTVHMITLPQQASRFS